MKLFRISYRSVDEKYRMKRLAYRIINSKGEKNIYENGNFSCTFARAFSVRILYFLNGQSLLKVEIFWVSDEKNGLKKF